MPDEQPFGDIAGDNHSTRVRAVKAFVPAGPAIAFWLAIALPVLYIPFLVTGIDGVRDLGFLLGAFCLHLAALYAGRSHQPR